MESDDNDSISVNKIYDVLKSRDFIQDVYFDLMSDFEKKPSYKLLTDMVNKLIENQSEAVATTTNDKVGCEKRQTIIQELCVMSYTVDTFLSKVLYKKLCNGFHSIISNALKDSKENVAGSSSSVISSLSVSKDREEANTKIKIAKSGHDSDSESSVGKITVSSVHTSELSSYDDNVSISSEEEGGGKKRVSLSDVKEKYLKRGKSNGPNYKKKKTGEMQSFSLNNKEDSTFECNEDKQVPEVESSVEDSPRKTLPPRIRKPNAKYASDSIICPVKLLSSTEKKENEVPSCSGEKSGSKLPLSAVRKRGRPKKSSIDSGGSSKTEMSHDLAQAFPVRTSERHLRNGAEPPTSLECSSKYYESSDLYKPRPVFGRSGLRGSSAVTLFTTSVHNSKH